MSHWVDINIQDYPILKEEKPKVESGTKPKLRCFQQSTSTQKDNFNVQATGLEYKVLDSGKQKHTVDFMKKCNTIAKFAAVNFNPSGTEMTMTIKNT